MRNPFRKIRVIEVHNCGGCGDRELKSYLTTPAEQWVKQNWTMLIAFQLFIGFAVGLKLHHLMRGSPRVFRGVFAGLVAFGVAVIVAQACIVYVPHLMAIQVVLCILTAVVTMYKSYREFGWL